MLLDDRLVFIIAAPRSGTTLLARLLHATPGAWAPPEPHLLPGVVHCGLLERVERAPYDPIRGQRALRAFSQRLPGGRDDIDAALRGLVEGLYARALEGAGRPGALFVDKTPANALVIRHLHRLFPRARFLLLTRHPAAVFHSYATSFFDGDFQAAWRFHPLLVRYLPRLAWLARQEGPSLHRLRFEDLVQHPERELAAVCAFLGLGFDLGALDYHRAAWPDGAEGDPTGVHRFQRPEPARAGAWTGRLAADGDALRVVARQLALVEDADLEILGWPRATLWEPLVHAVPSARHRRAWERYSRERRLLLWARRTLATESMGPLRTAARTVLEVLTRAGFGEL